MKTEALDTTVITSLSLDREVVRDLTSNEMNGAAGGLAAPQPDTNSVVITSTIIASEGTPVSVVVVTVSLAVSYTLKA